jgi:hypothetical protein
MPVIRNIDSKNYAFDQSGNPVTDPAKLSKDLPVVTRVYPIDKYEIPPALVTSARIGRMRILKVPLLGQAGYKGNWCGRTSMSMAYNWFQLLTESDPKDKYITHWNAGHAGWLMNLRLPSGIRAFTSPEETAESNSADHGYGRFAEFTNKELKKEYGTWSAAAGTWVTHDLDTYDAPNAAQRAARLGKLDEEGVQNLFEVVVRSIERNNPVFMYSGLTKGCNHLILLCGFAFIAEGAGENLWIAVADPATEDWIASYPLDGKEIENALDLTKAGASLDSLQATHNIIFLVKGDWNARRATLTLVRASFFLRKKGEFAGFAKFKGGDDFKKYADAHALVMDDVGNPHPGGAIFYSHDLVHQKTPDDAVLVREPRCVFPIDVAGIPAFPIPALHRVESRPPEHGGAYPLGTFENLHGGVHYPTRSAATAARVPIRAIAPGTIVAARVHNAVPADLLDSKPTAKDADELARKADFARELSANSPDFVLVRHELEIPSDPKDSKEAKGAKKSLVFHCLYMHLQPPDWGDEVGSSPWAGVPWLAALMRERKGTITVVDPSSGASTAPPASPAPAPAPPAPTGAGGAAPASTPPPPPRFALDGKPVTPMLGDHYWPAKECEDKSFADGTFDVFDPDTSRIVKLAIAPALDGRVAIVTKKPEGEISKALAALARGDLVSFPEPHRNLVVDAGTVIGFADPASKQGAGFMHWEILSPADGSSGVKKLIQLAAEHQLDVFKTFEEAEGSKNNKLDKDEELKLCALLPEEDKKEPKTFRDLRQLSFATSADGSVLSKDHYHLRIDVRNFEGILPGGSREARLTFRGAPGSKEATVVLEVSAGETSKIVEVPGWASEVEVESPGVMAREWEKKVEPADVDKHLRRILEHRWRNVAMRHVNEWSEADMLEIVKARFASDPNLEKLVKALCWWGDPTTPLYSSKELFGDVLPKSTAIDNVHPIVAVWVLNLLLERRHAFFKNPKSEARRVKDAKAMFAGWLPATKERKPLAVGEDVGVVAISNCPYDADLKITVVASGPGKAKPVLGAGQYRGDTYVAGAPLSGWGKFEIAITHRVDGSESAVKPGEVLGAETLELPEPVLAPHNGGPVIADGVGTWDIYFSGERPKLLLGYVVADARVRAPEGQPASGWTPCKVALPVRAVPVGVDEGAPEFSGGFLVRGPTGKTAGKTRLTAGIEWRELEAAKNPAAPITISQKLLGLLGALDAKYADETGSDLLIMKGSLLEGGCGLSIMATATKPPKGEKVGKSAAENNVTLHRLAREVGLTAALLPEGAAAPHHVAVSVDDAKSGGAGGVMRVVFDPKSLYGAVLSETMPGALDVVEVSLGCDFFNGGHLLGKSFSDEDDPETGEQGARGVIEGADLGSLRVGDGKKGDWKSVRSGRVDALASMPRIENVGLSLGQYGLQLTADLVGGDAAFWKAAAPKFKIGAHTEGSIGSSGTGRNARATLNATVVTQQEGKIEASGVVTIEAMTTKTATFGKAELAAGKVKWDSAGSPYASYDTTPTISKLHIAEHPKRNIIVLTATTQGIPHPLDIEIAVRPEGGDDADERVATKLLRGVRRAGKDTPKETVYFMAGPDGLAVAEVDTSALVKKLGKGPWVFTVRRPKEPKVEKAMAKGVTPASETWSAP